MIALALLLFVFFVIVCLTIGLFIDVIQDAGTFLLVAVVLSVEFYWAAKFFYWVVVVKEIV